jgi:8-hydroxy-5-deazaflavin:NADPH oxidoreductase
MILGGTGKFGRALATRLAEAGDDVTIGSRDAERARTIAAELGVSGAANEELAGAELVVLAVEAHAALQTVQGLELGVPLLSAASELEFVGKVARPVQAPRSLAEQIADVVNVPVVAGLHTLAAIPLAKSRLDEDAFVCGDDEPAKELALELAAKLVTGRAVDAGPIESARALEAFTAVLLNVNARYKTHAGIRVTHLS